MIFALGSFQMPTRERRARKLGIPIDQIPDGRGKAPKPSGSQHYRWNAAKMYAKDGYVKLRVGISHPLADRNGYAYEHLVVWCAAGNPRPAPNQVIHHRNEVKEDNRYENLQLTTRSAHNRHHNKAKDRDEDGTFVNKKDAG